jgi:transcriptional pleiotropic regulator of transition state genes
VTRKVDALGRVVLPVEVRRTLGIDVGDLVDVAVEEGHVVLRKVQRGCTFCGSIEGLRDYADRLVCEACITRLAQGQLRPGP